MIRVTFADREAIEHDANQVEFDGGTVVLRRVEFRRMTNPQNVADVRLVASNPQLIAAYSASSSWTSVENLDLDTEVGPAPAMEALNA